ncbi:MAG: sensor histidine kinase [Thioalkalivibrio sp.]|nr:sensor histidine kinase [Thioalkalivibrio sp.]
MRLSQLIVEQKESILREFEEFARTHTSPGKSMDVEALRDYAAGMLESIAHDLEQPQTAAEQESKAKGEAPRERGPATAAEEHGADRAYSGFSLEEAFGEYRALRASVMRHWDTVETTLPRSEVADVTRFNEAIDRAIAESVLEYSKAVASYRDMFLAVLGHDLRSPLNTIMSASDFLTDKGDLSERDQRMAKAIRGSGERMRELIDDLLDFASAQLGQGIPLRPAAADLGEIVNDLVQEAETTDPDQEFRTTLEGDLAGQWDVRRVRQTLSNLLGNALQFADAGSPISVSASGAAADGEVVVAVHNKGAPIPAEARDQIFVPFRRGDSTEADRQAARGLGLGLYIAKRMAEAHGGSVDVESSREEGTTFTVRLPRRLPGQSAK